MVDFATPSFRRLRAPVLLAALALALALPAPALHAQDVTVATPDDGAYILPAPIIQDFFQRDPNIHSLEHVSPDRNHVAVALSTELSTLERMGETTYRLAELELRPRTDRLWHLDTYGLNGLRIYSITDRAWREVRIPAGAFVSDLTWSPDGSELAFLAHLPQRTEVWTARAATGEARRFADVRVMATIGTTSSGQGSRPSRMLQWTPNGTLLTLAVPSNRGAEPARPVAPSSPMIRLTRDEASGGRTLPFKLTDAHDIALFVHYTRSQVVELSRGGRARAVGPAGMYESLSVSPDGRHLLATRVDSPFSYNTAWGSFPRVTEVLDVQSGNVLASLSRSPLREGSVTTGESYGTYRRSIAWRPDGAGITWLARENAAEARGGPGGGGPGGGGPGGGGGGGGTGKDRIHLLAAPFDTSAATVLAESDDPIRDVTWALDGSRAFATVSRGGRTGIVAFDTRQAAPTATTVLAFHETADPLALPGDLWSGTTGNGLSFAWVSSDGGAVYLRGPGFAADFRPRPFVDRVALADASKSRVFEGSADRFEQALAPLDGDLTRMLVGRESLTEIPDSWLWTPAGGFTENLTRNVDPFPETTAARRVDFEFTRQDGVTVQGRVSLPTSYREGEKVPAIFWTYPREFTSVQAYERAQVRGRNLNTFPRVTWLRWSDMWLTQGYAVVHPEIPIIGENYNDVYISSLVDAMYGALRAVDGLGYVDMDRIGHGGHSYGAFATANLLAHTPYFRAGIAGNGAYNRSLTPHGFQSERRTLWEAPHVYMEMSPFFKADRINAPILMYHGADDNNTGTWPMQSERFMWALSSLGKTAELYLYPYESHTPRAIENKLDLWARWIGFFDRYVKGDGTPVTVNQDGSQGGDR